MHISDHVFLSPCCFLDSNQAKLLARALSGNQSLTSKMTIGDLAVLRDMTKIVSEEGAHFLSLGLRRHRNLERFVLQSDELLISDKSRAS